MNQKGADKYGSTRPAGASKFRPFSARAPEEFHEALDAYAERTGIDKSEIVREATARAIGLGEVHSIQGKRAA